MKKVVRSVRRLGKDINNMLGKIEWHMRNLPFNQIKHTDYHLGTGEQVSETVSLALNTDDYLAIRDGYLKLVEYKLDLETALRQHSINSSVQRKVQMLLAFRSLSALDESALSCATRGSTEEYSYPKEGVQRKSSVTSLVEAERVHNQISTTDDIKAELQSDIDEADNAFIDLPFSDGDARSVFKKLQGILAKVGKFL